ncbi:MAG: TetR/AcrR family transcriptional regulator [Melioribacteraceae bacterium]|nr:TetR/AcrR family transcriptional regulator [Melioribacteraceae bacterium]
MKDKRTAILEATLKLISERGFHGTSMQMVADIAKVGAGTIYRYFENKEDLLSKLYVELKIEFSEVLLANYDSTLSFRGRFHNLWKNMVHYSIDNPQKTAYMEQYTNSPFCDHTMEEIHKKYFSKVANFINEAITQEVIKDVPIDIIAIFTFETAVALAKKHSNGMINLNDENIEIAVNMCWDALKK